MKFNEMKELLQKYYEIDKKVFNVSKEIERYKREIKNLYDDIKSPGTESIPKNKNKSDSTANKVQKIIDVYEKRINTLALSIIDEQEKQALIIDLLSILNEEERKIITLRYKDNMGWEYIPRNINCSRRTCFRIHDKAIMKMIEANIPNEEKIVFKVGTT